MAYALGGFQAPVDNAPTVNTGKPGRTYPVKFKLTDALGNPVTTISAITAVDYKATSCSAFTSDPTDALEANTTASSGLRYDGASGSFIYNWASPSAARLLHAVHQAGHRPEPAVRLLQPQVTTPQQH